MSAEISAETPAWSRERPRRFWDPSRKLLRAIRGVQAARNPLTRRPWRLRHAFWQLVTGAKIAPQTEIGGGLLLPHPNGLVIPARVHPRDDAP